MPKKSIDDKLLLQLAGEGHGQAIIAEKLGCSVSGVSRRLAVLKKRNKPRPAELDRLPDQQQAWVLAVASGKSNTQAAMECYNCSSRGSAKSIGSEVSKLPAVQAAVAAVLADEGITRQFLARHTRRLIESEDENVASRNVALGWTLTDSMPVAKSMNVNFNMDNICPVDLSRYR